MLVYGDPGFTTSATKLVAQLRDCAAASRSLDDVRVTLTLAGQLEQGLTDHFLTQPVGAAAQEITDAVARWFCHAFAGGAAERLTLDFQPLVAALGDKAEKEFRVNVPEGFAFYSLFPEQYILSAQRWARDHADVPEKSVLIVGLRSIGTTLSAVVAATLEQLGWRVRRITVRPDGSPFRRWVLLRTKVGQEAFALVVDEGPGLSGSSMVAAAEALTKQGIEPERVAFFPAHDKEPGESASDNIRRWWRDTPRYTTDLHMLRWNGKSLNELLASASAKVGKSEVASIDDASGGLWRRFAYEREDDWPAANIAFERAKFLVTLKSGEQFLWRFTGFLSQQSASRHSPLAIETVAHRSGFTATKWIPGTRLRGSDVNDELLCAMGQHIRSLAGEPLSRDEAMRSVSALNSILINNTTEAFGAPPTFCFGHKSFIEFVHGLPSHGDGRLAPHEFIRRPEGRLFKANRDGHGFDHTCVGRQTILWDMAGAVVEWNLTESQAMLLMSNAGIAAPQDFVIFNCAAYAALRLGMFTLAPGDSTESRRSEAAREFYREALHRLLALQQSFASRTPAACG
jgi:hypothetical protein